ATTPQSDLPAHLPSTRRFHFQAQDTTRRRVLLPLTLRLHSRCHPRREPLTSRNALLQECRRCYCSPPNHCQDQRRRLLLETLRTARDRDLTWHSISDSAPPSLCSCATFQYLPRQRECNAPAAASSGVCQPASNTES